MKATRFWVYVIPLVMMSCAHSTNFQDLEFSESAVKQNHSGHITWGEWYVELDPETGKSSVVQERNNEAHFNVTSFLNPPKCDDCLKVIIAGWNPVSRIADVTIVLKNPTQLTGYDVKTVLSNYDLKEFLNPDAWCDFYTQGNTWEPYYIFAQNVVDHAFSPGKSYARGIKVYFPKGASGNAKITVDASYPGPQEEPWRINNIIVSGPLQNDFFHYIGFTAHVYDHQDNVKLVIANLTPLAPSGVSMGDDGACRDYLPNDDIWGATNVKTNASPGDYTCWIKAQSEGSSYSTFQKFKIKVIPPLAVQPPLYIVSMMHAEEWTGFLDESTYKKYSEDLRELMAVFNAHGAKIALGPDWTFIQGTQNYDPTLFADFQSHGHGVDTHAHETTKDLGQVHNMLDSMNVKDTIIANGGFTKKWNDPPGGNWAAYVAHFKTTGGQQMFLASVAYKDPASQIVDSLFTPIRPSLTGDWMVHNPNGPLVYISGGAAIDASKPGFFTTLPQVVEYFLAGVVPGKINCMYWHDSVHNYGTPLGDTRIVQWDNILSSYFDGKVKNGTLIWANFIEMYQIYLDWEDG